MDKLIEARKAWPNKSDEWLYERLAIELSQKVEEIHRLLKESAMSSNAVLGEVATVKETSAGPDLYIGTLKVRSWLGTIYNEEAHLLCEQINTELKVRSNFA